VQCGAFIKWGEDEGVHAVVASRGKIAIGASNPDVHIPKITIADLFADQA
jgi:hypothetical protein